MAPRSEEPGSTTALQMRLIGANRNAAVTGAVELPGKINYFTGNDSKRLRTNVPTYARVREHNIYPGVDLVYYGTQGGDLEYDFVVAPGAGPRAITLGLAAGGPAGRDLSSIQQQKPEITSSGDRVIKTAGGDARFHKPVVYQERESEVRSQDLDSKGEISK